MFCSLAETFKNRKMVYSEKHTTTEGNKLDFVQYNDWSIVVYDNTCQLSRVYIFGQLGVLGFDAKGSRISEVVKDANQVVTAWKEERIWF
jgi:hypothetical protein